ncbi:MAG: hypothetical protein NTZ30_19635 [Planctomycetota bacterium]|nr:hypothetical protein [Planctomycetota bacterium]
MSDFFTKLLNKISKNVSRRKPTKWNKNQIKLDLLQLEDRITPSNSPIIVTTNAASGTGSLDAAITLANTTAGDDIIDFNFASVTSPYTITLAGALPNIIDATSVIRDSNSQPIGTAGTVTINGLGASSLTISGSVGGFSIFNIASGGNLTISGVTVTGAKTSSNGGGFDNNGTLSISNSTITLNSSSSNANGGGAGGIFNNTGATLTVSNSTITSNKAKSGAGIHNFSGTVTVSNSTISANQTYSDRGGAIYNNTGGTLIVANSTLSDNSSVYAGGGICNKGVATISNTTIANNKTFYGGGISNEGGTITLTSSTIATNSASINGGGIDNRGILNIANTIIANSNTGGDYAGGGTVNLINGATAANNIVTLGSFPLWATTEPTLNLGSLTNNGGPTKTIALTSSTPASVTAGGNASISNNPIYANGLDQRGYTRSTTAPSIGAYEFNGTAPAAPGAPTNVTGTAGNGQVALTWTAPSSNGGAVR